MRWIVGCVWLTACGSKAPPVEPAPPPAAPVVAATPAPPPAAPVPAGLPTAADLAALFDRATRVEARSGKMEKPAWSRDLTDEQVTLLREALGDAPVEAGAPRCLPTVTATLFEGDEMLATFGAFCGQSAGPIRVDVGPVSGSLMPQDYDKLEAALAKK